MDTDIQFQASTVVRSYSFEVEQRLNQCTDARSLGQALVRARNGGHLEDITSPWRCFFETHNTDSRSNDPIIGVLETESVKLRDKWVKFYQQSEKDDRLDLRKFEPTIAGVVSLVASVTTEWQSKRKQSRFGKASSLFHRLCGTLKSHSSLLKLLPESNEYVAIFAGSLNAIIKASANHEKIAEGLADGLCVISERVDEAGRDLSLAATDDMKRLVADLYEHIFLFLNGVMDWILQKCFRRLLKSFNETFKERFEAEMDKINKKAERVRIFASQSSRAELRVTRLVAESLTRDVRLGLNEQQRRDAELRLVAERLEAQLAKADEDRRCEGDRMRQLSGSVVVLLEADAAKWFASQYASQYTRQRTPTFALDSSAVSASSLPAIEDIAANSRQLEDFFSRDRVRIPAENFGPTPLGDEIVTRLEAWSQGLGLPILWFEGPSLEVDEIENPLTGAAAKFIPLAEMHQLQVISYFCELPRSSVGQSDPEESAAISLLYSLLRQMVEILPPRLETTVDLSESRFTELNGSVDTWLKATALFRDVLSVVSGTVFCVIDGLHWLDSRSTDALLANLLQLLRNDNLRVLFTTSGRSGSLLDGLGREETCILRDMSSYHATRGLDWGLPS